MSATQRHAAPTGAPHTAPGDSGAAIQVVVRVRPPNAKEEKDGTLPVVTTSTEKKEVSVIRGAGSRASRSSFKFDKVFGTFSTQEEVFTQTVLPIIGDVRFLKQTLSAAAVFPVPASAGRLALSLSVDGGLLLPFGGKTARARESSICDRFFLGGASSISLP